MTVSSQNGSNGVHNSRRARKHAITGEPSVQRHSEARCWSQKIFLVHSLDLPSAAQPACPAGRSGPKALLGAQVAPQRGRQVGAAQRAQRAHMIDLAGPHCPGRVACQREHLPTDLQPRCKERREWVGSSAATHSCGSSRRAAAAPARAAPLSPALLRSKRSSRADPAAEAATNSCKPSTTAIPAFRPSRAPAPALNSPSPARAPARHQPVPLPLPAPAP